MAHFSSLETSRVENREHFDCTSVCTTFASRYSQSRYVPVFTTERDTNDVQFLGSCTSDVFKGTLSTELLNRMRRPLLTDAVLPPKDFKGMEESTYLSRAFSDQGVRLRLRKEPRAMMYVQLEVHNAAANTDLETGATNDHIRHTGPWILRSPALLSARP